MEWSEQLATGVPEIDQQHRQILERLNAACEACGEGRDPQEGARILDETGAFIIEHFCFEEKLLKEQRSAYYEEHKTQHDQFIFRFQDLRDRLDFEGPSAGVREELLSLTDFLVGHFVESDRQLAPRLPLPVTGAYTSLN